MIDLSKLADSHILIDPREVFKSDDLWDFSKFLSPRSFITNQRTNECLYLPSLYFDPSLEMDYSFAVSHKLTWVLSGKFQDIKKGFFKRFDGRYLTDLDTTKVAHLCNLRSVYVLVLKGNRVIYIVSGNGKLKSIPHWIKT